MQSQYSDQPHEQELTGERKGNKLTSAKNINQSPHHVASPPHGFIGTFDTTSITIEEKMEILRFSGSQTRLFVVGSSMGRP